MTENDQVVIISLKSEATFNLTANVTDPRNNTVSDDYYEHRFYLTFIHDYILNQRDSFPVNGFMEFLDLPAISGYNLTYERLWTNWYQDLNFSYYESYNLSSFTIDSNLFLNVTLTPSTNDFPMKVVDSGGDPVNATTIKLQRYNYQGVYEEVIGITNTSGIYTFNNLEYDYNWNYTIIFNSFPYYTNLTLDYKHNKNYVDSSILIPI